MLILSFQDPGPVWNYYAEGPVGGAANLGYFNGSSLGTPSNITSNYRLGETADTFESIGANQLLITRSDGRSQIFSGLDPTNLDGFST